MGEDGALRITALKLDLSNPADAERILLEPGIYDCLSISDTGRGIPEDLQESLFDPFFSTKVMGRTAVGLGLSSAYGFIRQCGGTIYVESEPGRGTSVKVYLPAKPLSRHP
jgi:signal transduction histidine kinase